jgi:hypothetical protein
MSLYARALGAAFDLLPKALRRFHSQTGVAIAEGTVSVTRGRGRLRNFIATAMRLPREAEAIRVRLKVTPEGDAECWLRQFGDLDLATRQWLQGDLLTEAAGWLRFVFRLSADTTGMVFSLVQRRVLCVPLPALLAPCVSAATRGNDESWCMDIRVTAPIVGMLVCYSGEMRQVC